MTENELRRKITDKAWEYLGMTEADARFDKIIDDYNAVRPLPRNYTVKYSDDWCAVFVTYCFDKCGMSSLIKRECGVYEMVSAAKQNGTWHDKNYVPKYGDLIVYLYNGKQYHIGIVSNASAMTNYTTEGNVSEMVVAKCVPHDSKDILGYIAPHYEYMVEDVPKPTYRLGYATTDLYMRTGPGVLHQKCNIELMDGKGIRNHLFKGEEVKIIGEDNGWLQIFVEGRYTWCPWVSGKYIKF